MRPCDSPLACPRRHVFRASAVGHVGALAWSAKPSLADNISRIRFLALQARPNSYLAFRSGIFGNILLGPAWGVSPWSQNMDMAPLLLQWGHWDFRRYEIHRQQTLLDIIQWSSTKLFDGDTINFFAAPLGPPGKLIGIDIETDTQWQLRGARWLSPLTVSDRPDGWMEDPCDVYACPTGRWLLRADRCGLQVKKDRSALNLCLGFLGFILEIVFGDCLGEKRYC